MIRHRNEGRNVLLADAEDTDFWHSVELGKIQVVILAIGDLESKVIAARKLRGRGFAGPIITHALYSENVESIKAAGADEAYLTMHEAGVSLASHAIARLENEGDG